MNGQPENIMNVLNLYFKLEAKKHSYMLLKIKYESIERE